MSDSLPPDLRGDFRRQIDLHWENFLAGRSLPLGNLTFRKEADRVIVQCFSDKYFIENVSSEEGHERINTAKEELRILSDEFPELQIDLDSVDYEFCFDTGKSAVLIASEQSGVFTDYKNAG